MTFGLSVKLKWRKIHSGLTRSGFLHVCCFRYKRTYKIQQDVCYREVCEPTLPKRGQGRLEPLWRWWWWWWWYFLAALTHWHELSSQRDGHTDSKGLFRHILCWRFDGFLLVSSRGFGRWRKDELCCREKKTTYRPESWCVWCTWSNWLICGWVALSDCTVTCRTDVDRSTEKQIIYLFLLFVRWLIFLTQMLQVKDASSFSSFSSLCFLCKISFFAS